MSCVNCSTSITLPKNGRAFNKLSGTSIFISPLTTTWQDKRIPSSTSAFDKNGISVGFGGSCQSTNLNLHVPHVALPPQEDGKNILLLVNAFKAVSLPEIVMTLSLLTVIVRSLPPPNNLSINIMTNVIISSKPINMIGVNIGFIVFSLECHSTNTGKSKER